MSHIQTAVNKFNNHVVQYASEFSVTLSYNEDGYSTSLVIDDTRGGERHCFDLLDNMVEHFCENEAIGEALSEAVMALCEEVCPTSCEAHLEIYEVLKLHAKFKPTVMGNWFFE